MRLEQFSLLGLACFVVALLPLFAVGQTALPPEVKADVLNERILRAAERNDDRAVIAAIDEYKALDKKFPPALRYLEARSANRIRDHWRAVKALKLYLASADRSSIHYQQAIGLHDEYVKLAVNNLPTHSRLSTASVTELLSLVFGEQRNDTTSEVDRGIRCGRKVAWTYSFERCVITRESKVRNFCNSTSQYTGYDVLAKAYWRKVDLNEVVFEVSLDEDGEKFKTSIVGRANVTEHSYSFGGVETVERTNQEETGLFDSEKWASPSAAGKAKDAYQELARRCRSPGSR